MKTVHDDYARLSPVIDTSGGKVRGYVYDGVYSFKNIKYAKAPRFESPVSAQWEGVRDCTYYGYVPPLIDHELPKDDFFVPHCFGVEDEDCLNLNVWTDTLDPAAKRPVVVCVYGGSFATGSAIEMRAYDGTNLAREGQVVYVSLNMRINILGFFNLSCFGERYQNSGNLGFEDVLCALRWVRDNIAAFGGDPDNVTLMGMQGGALRIRYIMQCAAFQGLFHKAFLLSGIADHGRPPKPELFHTLAKDMLRKGGFDKNDVTPLKEMPFADLVALYRKTAREEGHTVRWRLDLNGWCFGRTEDEGVCPGMENIIVVGGNTFTEQYFPAYAHPEGRPARETWEAQAKERFGDDLDEALALYRRSYPWADERDILYYGTAHRAAALEYADALNKAGMTIYTYLFAPEFPMYGGMPAFHCSDTPYLTRNTDMVPALRLGAFTETLQDIYSGALLSLAHKGTPASETLADWRPYTAEDPCTMVFSQSTGPLAADDRAFVRLMEQHPLRRKK